MRNPLDIRHSILLTDVGGAKRLLARGDGYSQEITFAQEGKALSTRYIQIQMLCFSFLGRLKVGSRV